MQAFAQNTSTPRRIHPKKFALWCACASILMMFAAFTSAYVVRQAAGNWLEFKLPDLFFVSTGIILLSSFTLQASYFFFKKNKGSLYRGLMLVTFLLGIGFIVTQYQAWLAMVEIGVELTTNPSGSFIYVISGVHAAHVLGGIAVLVIALYHAFGMKPRVTSRRKLRFELTLTYWHFVGVLWMYLLMFFILQ